MLGPSYGHFLSIGPGKDSTARFQSVVKPHMLGTIIEENVPLSFLYCLLCVRSVSPKVKSNILPLRSPLLIKSYLGRHYRSGGFLNEIHITQTPALQFDKS